MTRFVALFKGGSQYGAVRAHVDDLAAGFAALGVGTEIVDLAAEAETAVRALLARAEREQLALLHGMVGWGAGVRVSGQPLTELLRVPFIHHMQDPPYYTHERLTEGAATHLVAVHDPTYESYLQRIAGLRGPRQVLTCGGAAPEEAPQPFSERTTDILIAMSVTPRAQLDAERRGMPPLVRDLVGAVVEELLNDAATPVHDVVFRLLAGDGIEEWYRKPRACKDHIRFSRDVMMLAYQHLHAERRLRLAPQLLQLPAVIYGNGWEGVAAGATVRADVRGPADFRRVQAESGRARMVLNVMPPVCEAPHDRTFYAMLAGAVYVTDPNPWFDRACEAGRHILTFARDTHTLVAELESALADRARLEAIAAEGQALAVARHSWTCRAQELLDFAVQAGRMSPAA